MLCRFASKVEVELRCATNSGSPARTGRATRTGLQVIYMTVAVAMFALTAQAADPPPANAAPNAVRESIPADAFFAFYLNDIDDALSLPMLDVIADSAPETRTLLEALTAVFDGSFALAITGPPVLPVLWRYTIVSESKLDTDALRMRLAALGAAWNNSPLSVIGAFSVLEGEVDTVCVAGQISVCLEVSRHEDLLILNNRTGYVNWRKTAPREGFLVNKPEWSRVTAGLSPDPPYAFAYLDLRAIVPLASLQLEQALPKLYEALQLSKVSNAALVLGRMPVREIPIDPKAGRSKERAAEETSKPREDVNSAQPRTSPVLRLALGVPTDVPGPWRFLAPEPVVPTLSAAFPPDTSLFVHNSMTSAAALMDDLFAIQAVIDQVLVDEFVEERADFKRDVGFDPRDDFLSNLVSEWAFGGRIGESGIEQPLLAVRIAEEDRFRAHLHALRSYFDLKTSITTYRGVNVETANRSAGPFSFAIANKTLLASTEPQAVADAVDALLDKKSLAQSRRYRGASRRTPEASSHFLYLNLADVASHVRPLLASPAARDYFTRSAEAGDLAFTIVGRSGVITADLSLDVDLGADAARVLREVMSGSRRQTARQVAMVNMRSIVMGCVIHAAENKHQWPESLELLVANNLIPGEILNNPYQPGAANSGKSYYLYRRPADPGAVKDPSAEVVLAEPELRDGGVHFAFMDGHVEFVTGERARQWLARMKQGR